MTMSARSASPTAAMDLFYEEVKRIHGKPLWQTDGSPHDGVAVEYTNPLTGGPALPTIACCRCSSPSATRRRFARWVSIARACSTRTAGIRRSRANSSPCPSPSAGARRKRGRKTARRQNGTMESKYMNSASLAPLLTVKKGLYTPSCCKAAGGFAFSSLSERQVRQAARLERLFR